MSHEIQVLIGALLFCIALTAVVAGLCRIGEKNRKKELDDIFGG